MAEDSVQISNQLVISSVHVSHNVSQEEKDKNSSTSSEKSEGAPASEMPMGYYQTKAHTCIKEPSISVPNVMTKNINPKLIWGTGYKLTKSVENVLSEMEVVVGSNTNAQQTITANANNVTTMNNKDIDAVSKDVVNKSNCHAKNINNIRSASGLFWKKSKELAIDLRIWESHIDWFNSINRGSHCIEDNYENFQRLVKVESLLGVMFKNSAGSTTDGLAASTICKRWPDDVHDVTDENLCQLLSKSPLYKYDIEKAVWKKWFVKNGTSIYTEDTHWNGILYLRKIFAELLELRDYSFLCLFLDAFHSKSTQEIVKSISEKSKVPACSKLLDMVICMLLVLYDQGIVVKCKPTQPALLQGNNLQINLLVNSQKSDLSSDKTAVTPKETLIVAAKSSMTNNLVHLEVSSLNCSKMQTPPQSATRWNDATLPANNNVAVPLQILPLAPPYDKASTELCNNTNNDNKNASSIAMDDPSIGRRNPLSVTGNHLILVPYIKKRGKQNNATDDECPLRKKMTIKSASIKNETTIESTSPKKETTIESTSPKKKNASPKRKMTPESLADKKYFVPLSLGWVREVVYRKITQSTRCDIYYHPPEGRKLRSLVEIGRYLNECKIENLTMDNFTFWRSTLGFGAPFELARDANEGSYFKMQRLGSDGGSQKKIKLKVKTQEKPGSDGGSQKKIKLKVKTQEKTKKKKTESNPDILNDVPEFSADELTEAIITNELGETTGYEEFIKAKNNVLLSAPKTSENASTTDVMILPVLNKQISNNSSLASGSCPKGSLFVKFHNQIGTRIAVAGAITSGEMKASSDNLKVVTKSDVDLNNKWLDIIEKYQRRKKLSLFEKDVKGDSSPTVSPTNSGNSVDKESPLNLRDGSVNSSKPSTSGTNQSGMSQIKVRNWSELSSNESAPFPVIKPNLENTRPHWTYCTD